MDEYDEYELKFDAYTPDTIPMERLALYLAALAKLLGHESSVHFQRLEKGSTRSFVMVEREAAPKVARRIEQTMTNSAANDSRLAYDELNLLLKNDNAVGVLNWRAYGRQPAVVLKFPGRETPKPQRFGPFTEPATVDGELVRIGGKDSSAHAQIIDPEGRAWSGEVKKDVAQRMAAYLYKGPVLRVRGDARWERKEGAGWTLISFKINDFDVLSDEALPATVTRLRSLRDSEWAARDDIDQAISASRGYDEGLH